MADSIAANYFEKYSGADAAKVLLSLPAAVPKVTEDNWLDFKSGNPQPADLEHGWSKALGAMANAGGGVIVWGIIAKKHGKPPVDAAEKLDLVPHVQAFASRLTEILRFATDPPLSGVRILAIPREEGADDGFVVCFIPEGSAKPYQSLRSRKPFYLRFGDESREPPLPILRQLFFPKRVLRVRVSLTPLDISSSGVRFGSRDGKQLAPAPFTLELRNVGEFTCEHVALGVECETADLLVRWHFDNNASRGWRQEYLEPVQSIARVLNPGLSESMHVVACFDSHRRTLSSKWRFTVYAKDSVPLIAEMHYRQKPVAVECLYDER